MSYNPKIHNRRSIRLKKYDYSRAGIYFITICVQDRVHLFGNIENGEMKLNSFGKIVAEEWEKSDLIRENITMGDYIIMPDHFHGIIQINEQIKTASSPSPGEFRSPSHSIGAIIRGIKGATTKKIKSILFSSWTGELQFAPADFQRTPSDLQQFTPADFQRTPSDFQQSAPADFQQSNTLHLEQSTPADFQRNSADLQPSNTFHLQQFAPADLQRTPSDFQQSATADLQQSNTFHLQQITSSEMKLLKKMDPNKSIWQRNYYEDIIKDQRHLENVVNYIKNNPKKCSPPQ